MRLRYLILGILVCSSCVKPYKTPEGGSNPRLLVVESEVIPSGDSSWVQLSRVRGLQDSTQPETEKRATVSIVSESGQSFPFKESGNGRYATLLNLNYALKYKLSIRLNSGEQFESDFQPILVTPQIDSLYWKADSDIQIQLNTKAPVGNDRFFLWKYVETWEYNSRFDNPFEKMYTCWKTVPSTNVTLGSTENISTNLVQGKTIRSIPNGSIQLSKKYHIRVKQYSIGREAYDFWEEIRKNGTETGGLFDPLPIQVSGNIQNKSQPDKQAIGFFSISTLTEKEIYINQAEIPNWTWDNIIASMYCETFFGSSLSFSPPTYLPAGYTTGYPGTLFFSFAECVDCRLQGGSLTKPSFWP